MANNAIIATNGNSIGRPVVQSEDQINSVWRLAQYASKSGLVKTNAYDAFFVIQYGWELGISPMAALQGIYVVNKKPTCSGQFMLALIRRSGLADSISIEGDSEKATVTMSRKSPAETYTATFTMQDARKAGLANKDVWKSYPAAMLKWRAVSDCGRFLFGDVIGGLYTVEEIADNPQVDETGAPIDIQSVVDESVPVQDDAPQPTADDIVEAEYTEEDTPQKPIQFDEGAWKRNLLDATAFMYDNTPHHKNSLKKLLADDVLNYNMSIDHAAAHVFMHRAKSDFDMSNEDVQRVLDGKLSAWLKNNTLEEAWAQLEAEHVLAS
jgi:hypothetical protein